MNDRIPCEQLERAVLLQRLQQRGVEPKNDAPSSEMNDRIPREQLKRAVLLQRLQQRGVEPKNDAPSSRLRAVDRSQPLPLSWAQQRLWFLEQLDPAAGQAYHMPAALRLRGCLDRAALKQALDRLVARHENLRTRFESRDGTPVQVIAAADCGFALEECDLAGDGTAGQAIAPRDCGFALEERNLAGDGATACGRDAPAIAQIEAAATRPFDLATGPLIRGQLLHLAADDHVLLIVKHHIISDGWSIGVLVRELGALYTAFSRGLPDPLAPLAIQYADYAAWQRETLQGETLARQVDFWTRTLAGAPALLELPTDRPRPPMQRHDGGFVPLVLPEPLTTSLRALSGRHGVTLFMTLMAGWAVLMARLSGQRDVTVGTPFANRQTRELEALIGFFVNTLAIRVQLDADPSVAELLAQVKRTMLDAYAHQDLPFEHVFEALQPVRSLSHSPIFQVMLALDNTPEAHLDLAGLALQPMRLPRKSVYFDLSLFLADTGATVNGNLEYASALFERATAQRFADAFVRLLQGMAHDERSTIARLPLLSEAERQQLQFAFNDSAVPFPQGQCLHSMFEAQAAARPDAVAVIAEGGTLSYGALDRRANQVARCLLSLGLLPDDRVALCVERGIDMLAGMLGILKAGGAYVPLDPAYPADRLGDMLADAAPVALLTQSGLEARIRVPEGLPVLVLDALPSGGRGQESECAIAPAVPGLTPCHLAYVIYTSGSTGKPKGVMLEHANVLNLVHGQIRLCGLTNADRVLQFASFSFDNSVAEIFPALSVGATLVLRPRHVVAPDDAFVELLRRHRVTVADLPTSFWHQWAQELRHRRAVPPASLRIVLAGGEKAEARHLAHWFADSGLTHSRWINTYGPTEAAVNAAVFEVDVAMPLPSHEIPIGGPVANTTLHVLDAHGELVLVGVAGEIHIGGASVARGYLNQPELTSQRFVRDPFSAAPGARLYKTGDLGRWRADGQLEYLGRNDFQVKLRGFRIELGEIEARLADCAGVREAVVLVREDTPGDRRLVAYVVAERAEHAVDELSAATLRAHLATQLPEHMLPSAFVQVDALPLTTSGKLDRKALPAPDQHAVVTRAFEPPQGAIELALAQVWQELLGLARVGRRDHFFELGGHSLLVVTLIERLRQRGIHSSVRHLFVAPVLCEFAALLADGRPQDSRFAVPPNRIAAGCIALTPELLPLVELDQREIDAIVAAIPGGAANIQDIYPLAPMQEGILFHHLIPSPGDPYLLRSVTVFDTRARLDECLAALQAVIDRHDVLRTSVHWSALRQPVQVVQREARLPVEALAVDEGQDALQRLLAHTDPRGRRIDLGHAPIMVACIAHDTRSGEWLMGLLQHHLVTDHVSLELVLLEIRQLIEGRGDALAPALPYRNFVAQTRAVPLSAHEAFFREMLGDVDEPTVPFGRLDVQGDGAAVAEVFVPLAPELTERIRATARRQGVSAAVLFHVAWAQVLAACTGRDDVVFGTTLSGRLQGSEGADRVLGMFINTLPVRVVLGEASVEAVVAKTWRTLADLVVHEQASLALAQRCSGVGAGSPLFTSLLNYHQAFLEAAPADAGDRGVVWEGMRVLRVEERTNYPITVSVDDTGEGFGLVVQRAGGIDAARVGGYFETALRGLVAALAQRPQQAVGELAVVPERELRELLGDASALPAFASEELIHQSFERQAAARPDAIALVCEDERVSYGELNARANRLAHRLLGLGVQPDDRVALCLERGVELIVAVLAILKAGAGYVPLDPGYPDERLTFMLEDSTPAALLTHSRLLARLGERSGALSPHGHTLPTLLVDQAADHAGAAAPDHSGAAAADHVGEAAADRADEAACGRDPSCHRNPDVAGEPGCGSAASCSRNPDVAGLAARHLAYVIYTSGSTGVPKGVMVEHAQVTRLFAATQAQFGFDERDVWSLFHSVAFDFSVWEIWGALRYGGRLVIVPALVARAPADFHALLCRERVSVLNQTPGAFRQLIAADAQPGAPEHALRCVIFGGEALEPHMLRPWIARHDPARTRLVNMYGITETTVHVTYREITAADVEAASSNSGATGDDHRHGSPIGAPLADLRLRLLDRHRRPVPTGVVGEMFVGGAGVARGYLNRPALNAERFIADPFESGARLYRSGDLARRLPDGSFEYLGRNDAQVKLRGFRIELGEIEARLRGCAGVREAVVLPREDVPGERRLVAYLLAEPDQPLSAPALRDQLATRLPDYMLPAAFVELAAFPLTANGKLDRKALPAPDPQALARRAFEPPLGPVETALAQIWQALLGVERVGRDDHFFELGGHSLLVVALLERLRQQALCVDVRSIFAAPTLRALAACVRRADPGDDQAGASVPPNLIPAQCPRITPELLPLVTLSQAEIDAIVAAVPQGVANVQDLYPLAPLQEGILFHHLLQAEGDAYLLRSVLAFDRRARLDAFLAALQAVIDRHDILRTAVHWQGLSLPVQVVQRRAVLPVHQLDPAIDALAQLLAHTDPAHLRLDLTRAPLLAAHTIHDPLRDEWLLGLLSHHLIDDNYTLQLILAEVRTLLDGNGHTLPAPLPYRNFIAQLRAVPLAEHEAYFRAQLADVDEPTAPFGVLEAPGVQQPIAEATTRLSAELATRLRASARSRGVAPAVLFHAAWARVVAACTDRDDVVFGTTLSGRLQGSAGADRVLGMFINTLPLRLHPGSASVTQLIAQTQAALSELLGHEQASLALAQRCSGVAAPLPLFTTLLNYRHTQLLAGAQRAQAWDGVRLLRGEERTTYPLAVSINDLGQDFEVVVQSAPGIAAERIAGYLATTLAALVEALAHAPDQPACTLAILPEAEQRQLLVGFNDTDVVFDEAARGLFVHQLFEQRAAEQPAAIALVFEHEQLTYAELNTRANRLAHHLQALSLRPDDRVAICLERGVALVVSLLAILKAGAAYVPLDPAYPRERLAFMLEDSAPAALLTHSALRDRLPDAAVPTLCLDHRDLIAALERRPATNPDPQALGLAPHHLAYVIYTSGSTGRPKGAMNQHDALLNRLLWARDEYGVDATGRVLQKTPFGFDVSVWEFFLPLLAGARLVVARPGGHQDPDYLVELIERAQVTMLHFVPSMLQVFLDPLDADRCPSLRRVLCSGEALPFELQQHFDARLPDVELHNLYGPTEAAIDVTAWACDSELHPGKVPIGRPIANIRMYVLDRHLQPVPAGCAGEIHIGGVGVARGYLNRPELTAERFVADPFVATPGARLYKTGDLGRWLPDGAIEYLGRNDFQVKIRGMRIELGEIESRLRACTGVREAVVIAREDVPGDTRLVAYLRTAVEGEPGVADLRAQLAVALPEYMVPSAFVTLVAFPLSPNGKLERKALPSPERPVGDDRYAAPRSPAEAALERLWAAVLGLPRVGIHDSFFDLGGHSLLAARLTFQIGQAIPGARVALVDFYRQPTIAAVAKLIAQEAPRAAGLLQPLLASAGPCELTLICCPYAGASAAVYQPLAAALRRATDALSLYAVAIPGNEAGDTADEAQTVESLAARCVSEILAKVDGPLGVYGHCVGSNLALEIVRRLEAAGRGVRFLAIGGAFPATRIGKLFMMRDMWRAKSDAEVHALIRSWGGSTHEIDDATLRFMMRNFRRDSNMSARYERARKGWRIAAPIYSIVGSDDVLTPDYQKNHRRWKDVSDTVHLDVVDGGHHYFIGDRANVVADVLLRAAGVVSVREIAMC